ncbi:MAG TPA: hypothetical protein VFF13_06610 [archaeon]|nr:hypothetical protein [archaeon]
MDFKKIIEAAKIPALLLIGLTSVVAVLGFVGLNLGIISLPIQFVILGFAGYNAVKAFKFDLINGALTGAVASFFSMIATIIGNIIFTITGVIPWEAVSTQIGVSTETVMLFAIIGYILGLLLSPIIGFIFGIIGAFIAQKT